MPNVLFQVDHAKRVGHANAREGRRGLVTVRFKEASMGCVACGVKVSREREGVAGNYDNQ